MMNNRKEAGYQTDPRIAIVDDISDVEETEEPFGKCWAVDVREEYAVFLKLDENIKAGEGYRVMSEHKTFKKVSESVVEQAALS